jgi:hypothetical protein
MDALTNPAGTTMLHRIAITPTPYKLKAFNLPINPDILGKALCITFYLLICCFINDNRHQDCSKSLPNDHIHYPGDIQSRSVNNGYSI